MKIIKPHKGNAGDENEGKLVRQTLHDLVGDGESSEVKNISKKEITKNKTKDEEFNLLKAKALRVLAVREHSVEELRRKLGAASTEAKTIAAVITDLQNGGFASDDRFAEAYVRSRRNKGYGPLKIIGELRGKGIGPDLIDEWIDVHAEEWNEIASVHYSKKFGSGPISDYKTWAKRAQYLVNRGFSQDQVRATVPEVGHNY